MQNLDVISVNLWQILISLLNLVLLFLIVKYFLFKPVKKMLAKRQSEIDSQYDAAAEAEKSANESRQLWQQKLSGAEGEADAIIQKATDNAKYRGEKLVAEAQEKAESIIRLAKTKVSEWLDNH